MIRAGFIGLGSQGAPIAHRIVGAGVPLQIWARRPATLEPFAGTGAVVAASPAELAANSDVVGVCVVDDPDVEDVVLRDDGVLAGMASGGVIAIHSTVHPDTCRRVAERAAERGVDVIDAPVSGGEPAAVQGQLLVMVGGEVPALEKARPVLETFGNPILHLGPLGSGQVAKLLNNFTFTAQIALALEIYGFAARLGLDPEALAQVLVKGSGASFAAATVAADGFAMTGLREVGLPVLRKDVRIMLDLAAATGVDEPAHVAPLARVALDMIAEDRRPVA